MPVQMITAGDARVRLAVHVSGQLAGGLIPLVCLPGYTRNMLDFADFINRVSRLESADRAIVAIDMPGRGRSSHLPKDVPYSTLTDANAIVSVLDALDIGRAIIVGQGHGGQVAMLVARRRPTLLAGTVLVDAAPVTDPRSIVRARNNARHVAALKSRQAARAALLKIVGTAYPGESETRLEALVERQYRFDERGRAHPLYDPRLITQLEAFDFDDVLEPQWQLFDALSHAPLMLVRTQLTDQTRRETFEEMARRREDAGTITISGCGSPALLDGPEEVRAILDLCLGAEPAPINDTDETGDN